MVILLVVDGMLRTSGQSTHVYVIVGAIARWRLRRGRMDFGTDRQHVGQIVAFHGQFFIGLAVDWMMVGTLVVSDIVVVVVVVVVLIDEILVRGERELVDAMVGIDVDLLARLSRQVGRLGIASMEEENIWY